MEPHSHPDHPDTVEKTRGEHRTTMLSWRVGIVAAAVVIGYFSYASMTEDAPLSGQERAQAKPLKVIQLDVLNGSQIKDAAAHVTRYLRSGGFDVVEMKNYKMTNVHKTVVVDRIGDLLSARRVAKELGVGEQNVVQQINPDYFVDVSVIIGEDYHSLKLLH